MATNGLDGQDFSVAEFDSATAYFAIRGLSPGLLMNALPLAVKLDLQEKAGGHKGEVKAPTTAEEKYEAALYHLPEPVNGWKLGIPVGAFHQAMVRAAMSFNKLGQKDSKKMTGVQVRGLVSIGTCPEDLVPVYGNSEPRWDLVTNSSGSKSAVLRGWLREWRAVVPVQFIPIVTRSEIGHLVVYAGQGVGVGAWRKENGGWFGRWEVLAGYGSQEKAEKALGL